MLGKTMTDKISTRKTDLQIILMLATCLLLTATSHAGVYKWTDENGNVHYGEQPGNTSAEQVEIRQNETTTPRAINKKEEDEAENTDGKNTDKADAESEKWNAWQEVPPSKAEKQRLCQEGKNDYAAISGRGRMREINEKGEYIYLSEQERQQRLNAAKKKQQKYCR
jgi:hypothetical protein